MEESIKTETKMETGKQSKTETVISMGTKTKTGQLFSMDFLAAVFIFIIVFGVLLVSWGSVIEDSIKYSERKDMELYASRIADFFVSGGGHPYNWIDAPENVTTIGLARTDRVIDKERLDAFITMDNETVRDKLRISGYNFYMRLVNADINKGFEFKGDGIMALASRAVIYEGMPDVLEMYIWRYS